jgi:large subunit ribosomal protein L46
MNALRRLACQPQAAAALLLQASAEGATSLRPAAQLIHLASFGTSVRRLPSCIPGIHSTTCAAPGCPTNPRLAPPQAHASSAAAGEGAAASSPLYAACVFERLPVVVPALAAWEVEYVEWQQQLLARHRKPLPAALADPKRSEDADAGPDGSSRWQPAPVETAADRAGDRRSLRRRLDQRIFMLVRKRHGGASAAWEFPHVRLEAGETTRAGAERALGEALSSEGLQPYFVGNAPAGHVALPGGAVFFHRCQLIAGAPAPAAGGAWGELAWAAKDELHEFIKDEDTLGVLRTML